MKTAELTGEQLDFGVAQALMQSAGGDMTTSKIAKCFGPAADVPFQPSTNWAQGGPIVDAKRIMVAWNVDHWIAGSHETTERPGGHIWSCRTALIAAMRVCVASAFGDDVPDSPR